MKRKKIDRAKYASIHYWLKSKYGVATECSNKDCKGKSKNFNWCLLRDKPYDWKRENFIQMCRSCHATYDVTESTRKKLSLTNRNTNKKVCIRGHKLEGDNVYILSSSKKPWRSCRTCRIAISKYHREKSKLSN